MERSFDRVWRDERVRIVGSLARRFGDLTVAEDAVQEAFAAASIRWPVDGTPDRPGAWLQTVATRKAIGILRAQRPTVALDTDLEQGGGDEREAVTDDDRFALILTCCHPALTQDARLALTLRHVCGLSVSQIAAAFVVSESAVAKRLVRARDKIRRARISFDPPDGDALVQRVDDVRTVIYLVFNEGYLASDDRPAICEELCDDAIWLARHLRSLRRDDETSGLLALMLLHNARRSARQDTNGHLVRFQDQQRSAWDHEAIGEARDVLSSTSQRRLGHYQVEAGIALLHVTGDDPDWARIADLYGVLSRLSPSPIVEVNRALAVGYADGAPAGLALLRPVIASGRLDTYAPLHAVHAELLEQLGDDKSAAAAWYRGAEVSESPAQRAGLIERARAVRDR